MRRQVCTTCRKRLIAATALVAIGYVAAQSCAFAATANRLVGLRRLSESEYRNSIADIFGSNIEVQGRFEPDRRVGGLLASSTGVLSVTPTGYENYTKMADSISSQVIAKNRSKLPCAPQDAKAPDAKCASLIISNYGLQLFRRPLTADELKRRLTLANSLAGSTKDFYAGVRYALASLMAAPAFLFRSEVAIPTSDGKAYTLDGYSRAQRLSYLMWDTTPDAPLLAAAASGELNTDAGLNKQVDRLMASPRLQTGVRAFFTDFLELDTFSAVSKDASVYPKYSDVIAASAKEETLKTAVSIGLVKKEDIRDLLTTQDTFINRPLASVYNVPFNFKTEWVPYHFAPEAGRSGLLTQVSMLGMFSHPGRSSPTKRGYAVLDIFMCQPIGSPPANVNFDLVNDVNNPKLKTVRQRLLAHATNATCASCHSKMDPIGLSLENFDSIGQYRVTENGDLIDASSSIGGKSFVGATGLGQNLHDGTRFPACFTRKMYAYGSGRSSESVEAKSYNAALKAFADSGYQMPTVLRAIATSPEFYSAPAPTPAPAETKITASKVTASNVR